MARPQPNLPKISWRWLDFNRFSVADLYEVLRLRQEVFVREQNCVYVDVDGKDPHCRHGIGTDGISPELLAYVRILPAGLAYDTPSIGRVVVAPAGRDRGLGRDLMTEALAESARLFPNQAITIGAQHHLESFYNDFGFTAIGDPYMDDGIMHVDMRRES